MEIKRKDIDKDLRVAGALLRHIHIRESEKGLLLSGRVTVPILSKWNIEKLQGRKITITRPDGSSMRLDIYDGRKGEGRTVGVLWLHGGGFVMGAPEMAKITMPRYLLERFNCVIVSPDYMLTTKNPYPAALQDAWLTMQWMKENRGMLGIDCEKLVVGGESAGGNLTVALCLAARDQGDDSIGFQIPVYPVLDDRDTRTSADNDAPVWNTKSNHAALHLYLGDAYGTDSVSKYAFPARETDYAGLPPAISIVGTLDPFYAETLDYFECLRRAGVDTRLHIADGCFHGFDVVAPKAAVTKQAVDFLVDAYGEFQEKYILSDQYATL